MFKFKKIASAIASTAMISSTVALAAAASYPMPFVNSAGSPDVAVVYGSTAPGGVDLAAAVNIADDLNTEVVSESTGNTGGSTIEGADSVLIAKQSDNLNLGNTWGVFTGNIDDDDMPTLLADGTYTADDNDDFDFEQKITLGTPTFSHFRDSDYESQVGLDERTPTLGFNVGSSTFVMNYTLEFTDDPESDVASGDLEDFEGSDLPLFGKTYYVSDAKNGSDSNYLGKFTLLDSAATSIVSDGETVTVTVGDSTYDVSLNFASTTAAKLNINGEITNSLSVGQTQKLADDIYIGVREINVNDYAGGTKNVEFSIGSGKLEITSGSDIKLNDESVTGVKGYIERGTSSSGAQKIDKIIINWVTDEEVFLTPEAEFTMPGFETLKFTMGDVVRAEEDVVKIEKDGDNSIQLTAPIKEGTVSFNILYNDASTGNLIGIGKDSDERLATSNETSLTFIEKSGGTDYHEWFVASYATSSEAESYLLRAKVTTDTDDDRNETTIESYEDGAWVTKCDEKAATDSCDIGQVSLTIGTISYVSGGTESVVLSGPTDGSVSFNELYTDGGLKIYLPFEVVDISANLANGAVNFTHLNTTDTGNVAGHGSDTFYVFMDGENKDEDIAAGTEFNFTINDNSDNNLQVSQVNNGGTGGSAGLEIGDSSTYEAYIVDDVAPRILHYTNPDEDWAEVYYPGGSDSETYAEVFLTESAATLSGSSGSSGAIVPIMDSEVASAAGMNILVVGGSCVNTVAAELLGSTTPLCGDDFTAATDVAAGSYLIETFERADKVATLVAGYNAGDTTNAATALTTQDIDTTAGMKYTGTTATSVEAVTETA